ncbi:MAG: adenylate kinase family protein, partial [Acetanaerobacterium sp.]
AQVVCDRLGIPTISTGNIIREAVKSGTQMGRKAKEYIETGALVPDDVIIAIIKERLAHKDCEKGFVLDGMPRTLAQAQALDRMGVEVDKVIDIEVSDERIERRMSGRRVCEACGASYHLDYMPPKTEGVCDRGDGKLVIRKDDHPDTVRERLRVYHEQTEPLKEYYGNQGKLFLVEGQEEVAHTTALVLKALGL